MCRLLSCSTYRDATISLTWTGGPKHQILFTNENKVPEMYQWSSTTSVKIHDGKCSPYQIDILKKCHRSAVYLYQICLFVSPTFVYSMQASEHILILFWPTGSLTILIPTSLPAASNISPFHWLYDCVHPRHLSWLRLSDLRDCRWHCHTGWKKRSADSKIL